MNKQEVIDFLDKKRAAALVNAEFYKEEADKQAMNEARANAYGIAIDKVKQMEESKQDKPVVKPFVAEWYRENKSNLESNIAAAFRRIGSDKHYTKGSIYEWLNDSSNEPIQTLLKMKNGYTVEQPKRWVVKVGNLYFCGWEDTTAQFVMNTALGEDESIIKYKNEGTASSVAKNLGGTVEKVLVEGSVEEV